MLRGCVLCLLLSKEEGSSPAITERRDMGLHEVPLSVFVGLWDGDYVSQLPYVWYYVVVKSSWECESKRAYVF